MLDDAHTGVGQTAQEAFAEIIALAQLAERRGYHRFWMSEHHAMPGAATSSPQMMLARLTGETGRIRLGAGGVMLPSHVPLMIAEQFSMLDTLAWGGSTSAWGAHPARMSRPPRRYVEAVTRTTSSPSRFWNSWDSWETTSPKATPTRTCTPCRGPGRPNGAGYRTPLRAPETWVLGSSPYLEQLAGQLGRPYAFALQFGNADVVTAMRLYRESFRPSEVLDEPYSLLSVGVVAHDDPAEARRQARSAAMAMLRMFQRDSYLLLPPEEVDVHRATAQEQQILDVYTQHFLNGTGPDVADALESLHVRTGVDEMMLVVMGHSRRPQARTVELIADQYNLEDAGQPTP